MISPHTPPGAEIVAIVTKPPFDTFPGIKAGDVFTVAEIVKMSAFAPEPFGVLVQEIGPMEQTNGDSFYALRCSWFRPLDIGRLDELLNVQAPAPRESVAA